MSAEINSITELRRGAAEKNSIPNCAGGAAEKSSLLYCARLPAEFKIQGREAVYRPGRGNGEDLFTSAGE